MMHYFKKPRSSNAVRRCPFGFSKICFLGLTLAVFMGLALLGSCSDSGGIGGSLSGVVEALSLPGRITLTQTGGAGASGASVNMAADQFLVGADNFDDPGTDYSTQSKDIWVEDTDALDLGKSS